MTHCNNGGCTKAIYRGKECFRCWAGTKWDSMQQRVRNRNKNYQTYEGLPLGFKRKEFIAWAQANPPPDSMKWPSVDRVVAAAGYVFGNIRWLELRKNSSGIQRDIQAGFKKCPKCLQVLPLNAEFFGGRKDFSCYCKPCERVYKNNWSNNRGH